MYFPQLIQYLSLIKSAKVHHQSNEMHIKPCKNDSDKNVLYIVQQKNSTDTTQSEKTINKSIQSFFEMASLKWYIYMYVSVVVLALDSTVIQLSLKV